MDEFNNRMNAQRAVLAVANQKEQLSEQLCGLSRKSIERWLSANCIDPQSEIASVLFRISSQLFFLAARSQEQVTDDYRAISANIRELTMSLRTALNSC